MIRLYYVSRCDESSGHTWDVIRRTVRMRNANGNVVASFDRRQDARDEARSLERTARKAEER